MSDFFNVGKKFSLSFIIDAFSIFPSKSVPEIHLNNCNSDDEYIEFKKSNSIDSSEIESFNFFSFREGRKKIYWKQQSVFNFLKQDSFCLDELELLIELGYIYKTKHPIFPLWLYNITTKYS